MYFIPKFFLFINTLRPRQNGCPYPDDIFKCIFLNENICIPMIMNISLKFVPKGQINNIPSLVQIMAWRRPGNKPLFEPMMVNLVKHICITRPQWVKAPGSHGPGIVHISWTSTLIYQCSLIYMQHSSYSQEWNHKPMNRIMYSVVGWQIAQIQKEMSLKLEEELRSYTDTLKWEPAYNKWLWSLFS